MLLFSSCRQMGEAGKVKRVHGRGPTHRRLLELGLIAEAIVRLVRLAPLGDPIEIELHGYHLSLRKAEAALVELEERL